MTSSDTFNHVPTYLDTYNIFNGFKNSDMDDAIQLYMLTMRSCDLRRRRAVCKHIETAICTQTRFDGVSANTLRMVRKQRRLNGIETNIRLRSLQRRVAMHLWRPRSRLQVRDMMNVFCEMPTSATM